MRSFTILGICVSLLALAGGAIYETFDHNHFPGVHLPSGNGAMHGDPLVPPIQLTNAANPSAAFTHDPQAVSHPHGETLCASGCAVSRHPSGRLTSTTFATLLNAYQQSPPTGENGALEEILFYSRQSREYWQRHRDACPDPLWQRVLDEELKKTHVLVSLRVLDESGVIRSKLTNVRVPLDRRHVFQMQSDGLPPLTTSGTVKRVGLDHLWTRL
ncbi:MAG: hypothetical protein VYA11_04725 [Planctomycetota bacterium]|nr:hypothetical protein [Planctomycetota bacterium]